MSEIDRLPTRRRVVIATLAVAAACAAPFTATTATAQGAPMTTASGLQIQDSKVGTGAAPKTGQICVMHYTGWLYANGAKGAKFDSSVDRGQPFEFPIGTGRVIKGWDEGVASMKVGGKRTLHHPARPRLRRARRRRRDPAERDAAVRGRAARREGLAQDLVSNAPSSATGWRLAAGWGHPAIAMPGEHSAAYDSARRRAVFGRSCARMSSARCSASIAISVARLTVLPVLRCALLRKRRLLAIVSTMTSTQQTA